MSLLLNMLSRLLITLFQGVSIVYFHGCSHRLQWFWSPKKQSLTLFPLFPHLFAMKWWDQMPWSSFYSFLFNHKLVYSGYILVQAAIKKLTEWLNRNLSLTVLKAEKFNIKMLINWVPSLQMDIFLSCPHISEVSEDSSLISHHQSSISWPDYIPKSPSPNIITLGIKDSTYECWRNTFSS